MKNANAIRFSTKDDAAASAIGKHAGFNAVWIGSNYANYFGVKSAGWYLIYSRGRDERFATA